MRLVIIAILAIALSGCATLDQLKKDAAASDAKVQAEALEGLEHGKHYLRHELARRLSLRRVPELHFEADAGGELENRIERLLHRARKTRGQDEKSPSK